MEADESGFMPDEVAQAYAVWLGPALRSPTETARILGIPKPRVANWVHRHRWKERALRDDLESRDGAVAAARATMARLLTKAVAVAELTLEARLDADGKTPPHMPTTQASKYAFQTLSLFGISPQRPVMLDVSQSATARISSAELDAIVAASRAGSEDALSSLLALAAGQLAPPPPVPQDFASTQPGGRGSRTLRPL